MTQENQDYDVEASETSVEIHGSPEQKCALFGALAKARAEFKPVPKSATAGEGSKFTFKYANLQTIQECTTSALSKHGLAVMTPLGNLGGVAELYCILTHQDGGYVQSLFRFRPAGQIKDLGSQSTYFARYMLQRMLCVDSGDDADSVDSTKPSGAQAKPPKSPKAEDIKRNKPNKPKATEEPAKELTDEDKSVIPSEVFTEPDDNDGEGPELTQKTSKTLNSFLREHKFKGPDVKRICQEVTGRTPDQLYEPGGEALGIKLMDHLRAMVDEK